MNENDLSKIVFETGLKIHRTLGVGLYETVYEQCLLYELSKLDLKVEHQKWVDVKYEELLIKRAFRLDLLVEEKLILEVKAVPDINSYHTYQLLNYLKITGCRLGMILNFHSLLFKNGVRRVVNNL